MNLKLKKGEVRYVKEFGNSGRINYYKFEGEMFYVWRDNRWIALYPINMFQWYTKEERNLWYDKYITKKEIFLELL